MKKIFGVLVALVLAWPGPTPALQARNMVSVDRAEVNMREGAGTQHAALWLLEKGYPLEVTGRQGNWLKVRDFENDTGWIYRPLVAKKPHVIVKAGVLNVRSTPGTRSRIVGKAAYGEVLRTLEHRNGWVRVQQASGRKGWVSGRLVWGW